MLLLIKKLSFLNLLLIFKNRIRNLHLVMQNPVLEILPTIGLGNLKFGTPINEIKKMLGEPQEIENLNELEGVNALVWHYWENGFSIFFDEATSTYFSGVEIDNEETVLWGFKVFDLNEKEVLQLFKNKGYEKSDEEAHEWGEKRVSYDSIQVDLYFTNNILSSINFGVIIEEFKFTIFPN